jgi:hypothetical protein
MSYPFDVMPITIKTLKTYEDRQHVGKQIIRKLLKRD